MQAEAERGTPFDVAIIDYFMPGIDALELQEQIKQKPELSGTDLILVTAFDKLGQDQRALSGGFKAYLRKPVRQGELFHALITKSGGQALEGAQAAPAVVAGSSPAQQTASGGLILIVEDHPANQVVAQIQLCELGFSVHIANNGVEALKAVSEHEYQLILMDCMMPEMDGFQATREIRKQETVSARRIPIIAMTARVMADDRENCISAGMDDYISKPVEMSQLRRILSKWLPDRIYPSEKAAAEPDARPVGDDEIIDLEGLLAMFGEEGVETLWRLHSKESIESIGKIRRSIESHEGSTLAFVSHKLKGACASLRCGEMRALCVELERLGKAEDWEVAKVKATDLQTAFERAQRKVDEFERRQDH